MNLWQPECIRCATWPRGCLWRTLSCLSGSGCTQYWVLQPKYTYRHRYAAHGRHDNLALPMAPAQGRKAEAGGAQMPVVVRCVGHNHVVATILMVVMHLKQATRNRNGSHQKWGDCAVCCQFAWCGAK